jgi:hypothetical protein
MPLRGLNRTLWNTVMHHRALPSAAVFPSLRLPRTCYAVTKTLLTSRFDANTSLRFRALGILLKKIFGRKRRRAITPAPDTVDRPSPQKKGLTVMLPKPKASLQRLTPESAT